MAIANAFVEQHAKVHITGTSKNTCCPPGIEYHACDFSNPEELEALCKKVSTMNFNILINNVGINRVAKFIDIKSEDFLKIQQVNLYSAFRLCQSVIPSMLVAKWGRIVNINSIFGIISKELRASYSASKFALDGMTVALAAEVSASGILVNSVAPGFIDTELTRKVLGKQGMQEMSEKVPIRRMGRPEEVAKLVLWLASEENTFLCAQNIAIDGGFTRV